MSEVAITIGGRSFDVSCQPGEEDYLKSAAALLDAEATALAAQIGRLPEARMLLMAGLLLADKTAGMEEQIRGHDAKVATLEAEIAALKSAPAPEPQRIEVPVIPAGISESMAEIAARAEALAASVEEKAR